MSIAKPTSVPRRVIIDTDPGVDDALALLFALSSPELEVEAITVVAGNVRLQLALENALRMVQISGRTDIPVSAGAREPLERSLVTATSHGPNGLGGVEFPVPTIKPADKPATEVIRTIVSSSPGEVSIISLGPLTNVASVLRNSPEVAKQIKEIVLMGGSLSGGNMTPAAEFNMYVDPEAASIVFRSGVPVTMVGLDVTRKCTLTEEHVVALEAGSDAVSRTAARITRNALERSKRADWGPPVMHDPLAVATSSTGPSSACRHFVAIETHGQFTAGETLGYKRAPTLHSAPLAESSDASEIETSSLVPNAQVAVEVDASRFFQLLIQRLARRG